MIVLFVPFLFGIAYCAYSSGIVKVLLASESQHTASDDFLELFDEFARRERVHFNKRNFRELERNINGLPISKYGLRGIDCEKLLKFLGEIKSQKYRLQYASVKCGRTTVSFCMAFDCKKFEFIGIDSTPAPKSAVIVYGSAVTVPRSAVNASRSAVRYFFSSGM